LQEQVVTAPVVTAAPTLEEQAAKGPRAWAAGKARDWKHLATHPQFRGPVGLKGLAWRGLGALGYAQMARPFLGNDPEHDSLIEQALSGAAGGAFAGGTLGGPWGALAGAAGGAILNPLMDKATGGTIDLDAAMARGMDALPFLGAAPESDPLAGTTEAFRQTGLAETPEEARSMAARYELAVQSGMFSDEALRLALGDKAAAFGLEDPAGAWVKGSADAVKAVQPLLDQYSAANQQFVNAIPSLSDPMAQMLGGAANQNLAAQTMYAALAPATEADLVEQLLLQQQSAGGNPASMAFETALAEQG
jgi:hypothetical protein